MSTPTTAGSLALWARAQGVPEVVGVDIDGRAIDYARFNARLNALPCEWATGDLSAPVRGRRFDAVVSQPAYVPQPPSVGSTTYLHGGARGDELALRLLGEIPGLLAQHGRAWVLFDTPAARPAELSSRVREALVEPNLDTLVLATAPQSTRTHTIAYASLVDPQLGAGYRDAVERYAKHFEAIGVTELRHVLLLVQHTTVRATGTVLEPPSLRGFDGVTLARIRAGANAAQASDDTLLDTAVVPAPEAWLVYEEALGDEPRTRSRVQFDGHRGIGQGLSDTAAVLLQSLRDHQPLHAAIEAQATAIDAEPGELVASVLEFVRGGLVSGLLVVRE
ncbi:MAG: methyltransferase [Deltaproteobacteria bacterium]|nr:methyltransferase [Nannocystaceae bacterium]